MNLSNEHPKGGNGVLNTIFAILRDNRSFLLQWSLYTTITMGIILSCC